jgi:hypothetical protein
VRDHRSYWVFARPADMLSGEVDRVIVPPHEAGEALRVTVPSRVEVKHDGATWYHGPAPDVVSRDAGAPVVPVKITPPRTGEVRPEREPGVGVPSRPVRVAPPPTRAVPAPRPTAQPPTRTKVPSRGVPGSVRVPARPARPAQPHR